MEDRQEFDISTYWDIIWQRRWLALTVFLAVILSTLYFTLRTPPLYRATSTIAIERGSETDLFGTRPMYWWYGPEAITKHLRLIKSRSVAKMVAEEMPERLKIALAGSHSSDLVSHIQSSISAKSVKESNTIEISATAPSPEIAIGLVNAVVSTYQKYDLAQRRADISAIRRFVEEQLKIVEDRLNRAEEELERFKETHKIVSLSDEARSLIEKESNFDMMYNQTRVSRKEAEQKLKYLEELIEKEKTGMSAKLENISSPLILSLKDNLDRLEVERANLLIQGIDEKSAKIKALDNQIEEIKKRIKEEASKLVIKEGAIDPMSRLKTLFDSAFELKLNIEGLQTREEVIKKMRDEYERMLRKLPSEERELAQLTRRAQTDQKIYALLSEKREQARITEAGRLSEIRIIDLAKGASKVQPKPKRNLTLGFFLALLLAGGLCFLLEYLDTSIKTPKDIERFFTLPLLATIPKIEERRGFLSFLRKGRGEENPRILDESSHRAGSEAFRILRTSLQYASPDRPIGSVVISSPGAGEGKTTVAINLAVAIAKSGKKTLLLDLDLRKSIIHNIFGRPRKPGFTEWVVGVASLKDIVFKTDIENLYCIFSGSHPPSPSDFFASFSVGKALEDLHKRFEFIVMDSAPVLAGADTSILAPQCESVILVVRGQTTDRRALDNAINTLEPTKAKILGVVLNGVEVRRGYYYYRYYHYYKSEKEPG